MARLQQLRPQTPKKTRAPVAAELEELSSFRPCGPDGKNSQQIALGDVPARENDSGKCLTAPGTENEVGRRCGTGWAVMATLKNSDLGFRHETLIDAWSSLRPGEITSFSCQLSSEQNNS